MASEARPGWDEYFGGIARAVARRGECTRSRVGCVIVVGHRIVSTGYNGTPAGDARSCLAGDCPRGAFVAAPGSFSEPPPLSECIALHAEQNAIAYAGRVAQGGTAYVTKPPCSECAKLLAAAGVTRTVVV